jgi:hypothetical protein
MSLLRAERRRRGANPARGIWLLWLFLGGFAGEAAAATEEYQLKAVFLVNFALFVEWPPEAFPAPGAPLVIGILGQDPFGSVLDDTVRGETANGRTLTVKRYRRAEDVETCHILFIDRSEAARLSSILKSLQGRSVLTVGDFDGFSRGGGVIRFSTVNNKLKLRISLDAARNAQLVISSKLLRPAEIVAGGED